jgi:4-amino-4-deoxy-L-arabinose transferase-like glycosyltransferase
MEMAAVQAVEVRTKQVLTTVTDRAKAWVRDPWIWLVALMCLATIALSTNNIAVPLDRDEGAFLAVAQRILHGSVPYRDVFDHKGPAIYYYLAGVLALTSPLSLLQRILVARVGVVIVDLATGLGIFILGRRWWSREVGLLAALFWFVAMPLYNADQFFTEPFAVAPTVWALVAAERWPRLRGAFVAGLLVALGSMFKQTAILALPATAVILLAAAAPASAWWRPTRLSFQMLGMLIAGAVLPWVIIAAAFALVGGLVPMLQQVVLDSLVHYPADPWYTVAALIRSNLDAFRVMWLMAVLTMLVGLVRWIALRRMSSPGAVALVSSIVLTAVPFRVHAYNHYFLQLVPAAALLAAVGFMAVLNIYRSALTVQGATPSTSGTARSTLLVPALLGAMVLVGMNRPLPMTQWTETYPHLEAQLHVGEWIASYAPPDARLLVLPAEPAYYYLANRTSDASYVYLLPVNLTPALMDQLNAQITAHHYSVLVWQQSGGGDGHEPYFAGLYSTVRANYHVIATYHSPEIFIFVPNE